MGKQQRFFGSLVGEHKRGWHFQSGGEPPLDETIDETKEVLINKGYHLTHEENINKIREATTTADTVKQCASKYSIERSQGHAIKDPEVRKSDLTNSGNLVEIS